MQPAVVAKWSKWLMWFTPIIKLVDPGSNPAWGIHKQYMNGSNTVMPYVYDPFLGMHKPQHKSELVLHQ